MKRYVYNYYKRQVSWLFHVLFWVYYFVVTMVAKIIDSSLFCFFFIFLNISARKEKFHLKFYSRSFVDYKIFQIPSQLGWALQSKDNNTWKQHQIEDIQMWPAISLLFSRKVTITTNFPYLCFPFLCPLVSFSVFSRHIYFH